MADPHVEARHMLVAMERTDGIAEPVLTPGNPIKMEGVPEGPETRVPWLGEHTDAVLSGELGLTPEAIATLRDKGVIG